MTLFFNLLHGIQYLKKIYKINNCQTRIQVLTVLSVTMIKKIIIKNETMKKMKILPTKIYEKQKRNSEKILN